MGYRKIKNFIIFMMLFFIGCDDGMIALNSQNPIKFTFLAKEKILKLDENKAYGLFFFTKSCGACIKQVRILNDILEKENFKVIAVLGDAKDYEDAKDIAKAKNINFPLIFAKDDANFLSNSVGGILGVPAIFFYDNQGKLDKKFLGLTPKSVLENQIKILKD